MICLGAIANAAGILIGGIAALAFRKQPSPATQGFFKLALGVLCVYFGLRLAWMNLDGLSWKTLKLVIIVILALMLGKLTGKMLRLQKMSNRIGRDARQTVGVAMTGKPVRWSDGFNTCTFLFCAAPLASLGAISDGFSGFYQPLAVKGLMDGLATMGFVVMFRWSALAAALPVFIFESAITTTCALFLKPFLAQHGLIEPVNVTTGLLIFSVGLLIFEIKKIEIADYLPSILFAPLIAWGWS